jgi:AraC-like DNA-binding protein
MICEMMLSDQQTIALIDAKRLIESSPFNHYPIKELSKLTGVSTTVLTKGFQFLFQITVFKYHLFTSMEYAKSLLEGDVSVKEVAVLFQYNSISSFSKAFKKVHGNLPSAYTVKK